MSENYTVYMHRFPNGKVYIGITKYSVSHRWSNGSGYKRQFVYKAIQKYGWEHIEHIVLFKGLTKNEAEQKEIELIKLYDSTNPHKGYNVESGGNACKELSEATKEKIREKHIGKKLSDETKRKISEGNIGKLHGVMFGESNPNYGNHSLSGENNPFYGKKHSPEVIEFLRRKATGVVASDKTRKKLSESHKGLFVGEKNPMFGVTGAKNKNSKKVAQYTKNEILIKVWDCAADVERELGIAHNSIGKCCNGNLKTAGGFIWRHYQNAD